MAVSKIDAALLCKMFLAGAANLDANKEWINELNVFPVPDGDTGTNMTLTIMSAAREVEAIDRPDMESVAKAISSGSLRGARGNSGVILSQLFRGFCKVIGEYKKLDCTIIAEACRRAVETAYKAVMKPKEGTILTVAKGISLKADELSDMDDVDAFLSALIEHGEFVLSQTPEMLPVLKEAGVVDSGGQGLIVVLKGALDGLRGKEISLDVSVTGTVAVKRSSGAGMEEADIKFGYCTEFIIMLEKEFDHTEEKAFKSYLESIGDSIVCVAMDDIVKVHVHTNEPGNAIQKGLSYGQLTSMKIDNMREEHHERVIKNAEAEAAKQKEESLKEEEETAAAERVPYGFVAVSIGEGMNEIYRSLGVEGLIEGGQTMNPSTEDMLAAIEKVNADVVYVFPNNKNIIMAANQAAELTEDKEIVVIPTKTTPQGIAALISFVPEGTPEENRESMTEAIETVKTGQVTYSVRDTTVDGVEIKKDDIMGIGDDTILAAGSDVEQVALEMLDKMTDEESELISIYYGEDISDESGEAFAAKVEELYPDCDVEVQNGGQPIYYYVISVE